MRRCLLKGHNLSYWTYIKKVPFDENVSIEKTQPFILDIYQKCLLTKRYLLKGYNHLGINSGLYSLDNYFFSSKKLVSKKHKKSRRYSLKLLFVKLNKLGCILGTSL